MNSRVDHFECRNSRMQLKEEGQKYYYRLTKERTIVKLSQRNLK